LACNGCRHHTGPTPEADKEPQNWLMNHRTYDGQRFPPLARINRDNVKT
jgi:glucose dehydrogenase